MIPIPKEYASKTCKMGQGAACCRYLAADRFGFCCLKGTEVADELDRRARAKTMHAQSDNCEGWTLVCATTKRLDQQTNQGELNG